MKKYYQLSLILFVALMLVGCRSSRHTSKEFDTEIPGVVTGEIIQANGEGSSALQGISAKLKLKLEAGDKSISCGGTYRLKRDEVVQIDLTYTVFIVSVNVGILELTKSHILVLDKINKRYCRAKYSEIPALKDANVDFDFLQRIFWGDVDGVNNSYIDCTCGNWMQLTNGEKFPLEIELTFKEQKASKYKATIELSKVQETINSDTNIEIPSGYEEVSLQTVMNAIMNVAK